MLRWWAAMHVQLAGLSSPCRSKHALQAAGAQGPSLTAAEAWISCQLSRQWARGAHTFASLGVAAELTAALSAQGVVSPSPIQVEAIPIIAAGRSCALQSCTGSGKTLAYLLPALGRALQARRPSGGDRRSAKEGVQVVVAAPSRELCMQIVKAAQGLILADGQVDAPAPSDRETTSSSALSGLSPSSSSSSSSSSTALTRHDVQQMVGGANPKRQHEALRKHRPWMVVGTPGRLNEMMRSGALQVAHCRMLVLDEVDVLATPKFHALTDQLVNAVGSSLSSRPNSLHSQNQPHPSSSSSSSSSSSIPGPRQTVVVSASLGLPLLQRLRSWCPDPTFISASATASDHPQTQPSSSSSRSPHEVSNTSSSTSFTTLSPITPRIPRSRGILEEDLASSRDTRPDGDASSSTCSSSNSSKARLILPLGLKHYYVLSSSADKIEKVERCVKALGAQRALIFLGHRRTALYVMTQLQRRGMEVERCVKALGAQRALIFLGHRRTALYVMTQLQRRGMEATALHGRLSKLERTNVMAAFRRGVFRAMVVTDLASRGLDFPDVDVVINMQLPEDEVDYAHRAGRTGRLGGMPGCIVSIVEHGDVRHLERMSRRLGIEVQRASPAYGKLLPVEAEAAQARS